MIVTFDVSFGSTNAYRSVLSATGSLEISGASRCDDIDSLLRDGAETSDEGRVSTDHLAVADHHDDLAARGIGHVGDDRGSEILRSLAEPFDLLSGDRGRGEANRCSAPPTTTAASLSRTRLNFR